MKNLFAKLSVLSLAIICLSCSKETSEANFVYSIISPSLLTVKITSCVNNGISTISIPSTVTIDGSVYSVTAIAGNAFKDCIGLISVSVPSTVTSIASNAFYGCSTLTAINVDQSDTIYSSADGVLFNSDKTSLIEFPAGHSGSYTIPSSVTSLGDYAFMDCASLTSITIPPSVISVGNYTFYGCSGLTSVSVPSSIISIGDRAFCGCSGLTSVTLPSFVTSLGSYAFSACSGLSSFHVANKTPSSITLGSEVFYFVPTSTCKLYVPAGYTSLYAVVAQWKSFSNIVGE
jgi:hypothetical protein